MANTSEKKYLSDTWKFYSVNTTFREKNQYQTQNLQKGLQFFPSLIIFGDSHWLLLNTNAEHLMILMKVK